MCSRICASEEERQQFYRNLKVTPCPHCNAVGFLVKHGFLTGYDANNQKSIRASRVFCSNRRSNACPLRRGCGRTFSVWLPDKIKHFFLPAETLWRFLNQALANSNKIDAFRQLKCRSGRLAAYRIWKRFTNAQSAIRTTLAGLCLPPQIDSNSPTQLTLAHLQKAFEEHPLSPIAAFQATFNTFFM